MFDLVAGDAIDTWVVDRPLGTGGMGAVFLCHHYVATRIVVAVKVLDPGLARRGGGVQRFVREAEVLYRLDHPNVVRVRNVQIPAEGESFIVMEYVEGRNLDDILEAGPLPVEKACDLLHQLLVAIDYLHRHSIFHRDIKPTNVLVRDDGVLKLVDFGLVLDADIARITQANANLGTPNYAPPEWIAPDELDPVKWDLYSIGTLAFEMLTGDVAFPGPETGSQQQQIIRIMADKQSHAPLDPGPVAGEPLRQLIRDLTNADPAARPTSARECIERLRSFYTPPFRPVVARRTTSSMSASGQWSMADTPIDARAPFDLRLAIAVSVAIALVSALTMFWVT